MSKKRHTTKLQHLIYICLLDRCMCIKSTKSNLTEKRTFWGYVKNINFLMVQKEIFEVFR